MRGFFFCGFSPWQRADFGLPGGAPIGCAIVVVLADFRAETSLLRRRAKPRLSQRRGARAGGLALSCLEALARRAMNGLTAQRRRGEDFSDHHQDREGRLMACASNSLARADQERPTRASYGPGSSSGGEVRADLTRRTEP